MQEYSVKIMFITMSLYTHQIKNKTTNKQVPTHGCRDPGNIVGTRNAAM